MKIQKLNVFTNGDAHQLSTWSNVPYLFTETLKQKGIKINYINTQPNKFIKSIYRFSIWQILKRIPKYDAYDYYRTSINRFFVNQKIKNAIKKYPNADANLFLNFSFSAKEFSDKPSILFGDWTYDLYFKNIKQREPSGLEQSFILQENKCIENADAVFVLFPKVFKYMKNKYQNKHIYYIGNVVNAVQNLKDEEEILQQKQYSNTILFIGSTKYLEGANALIVAVQQLQNEYQQLQVHIIGIEKSSFSQLPDFVKCYGYLDKAKQEDRNLYYSLLENAKMIVNTTPKWSGFSAVAEAMYFYNPVITTPYQDFTETFGISINFGVLNQDKTTLANEIKSILENNNYNQLCINAHLAVRDFTWNNYIDKFLEQLKKL